MHTLSKEARRHWLTLKLTPYLGAATIAKITAHYPVAELLSMNANQLASLKLRPQTIQALTSPNTGLIEELEDWCEQTNHHLLCFEQDAYPQLLKQISSPPEVLFVKGDPEVLSTPQLAIIGSRENTISGKENAYHFARHIAELGITVTSGLAIGIDGQSHRGAIEANGQTIAVLGTGLDCIYPKRHTALAEQIVDSGALVSEFLPQQGVRAEQFPKRNRIISGLSHGTLVVEAALKSGSLVTARTAMEQNREVFAIPGSIHSPMSEGCHHLIKQGAKLVENIHDIIEEVGPFQHYLAKQHIEICQNDPISKEEEDPFLACIGYEITPVDIIAQRSNLPVNDVLARLLDMEIAGKVAAVGGGYSRI